MKLERIVQVHVALLAILGAVLLGMGQRSSLLPLLAVFAAVTSVIFTDTLNWFHLNRFVANLAALLALFFSLNDFFPSDMRAQLLAIANLLIYLQLVLFYQRKNPRLYWQLTVLSLLQVVVAAALNVGFEFGMVLILYAVTAFSTLVVLHVHREGLRVLESAARGRLRREGSAKSDASGDRQSDRWKRWLRRDPIVRPLVSSMRLGRQALGGGLLKQIAAIGFSTLVFAFVLFFTAPKLDSAARRSFQTRFTRVVGFSSQVTLNEMASVLESDETVMRVSFRDVAGGQPYRVYGEPYFRGAVLTEYRFHKGVASWRQLSNVPLADAWGARFQNPVRQLDGPPPNRGLVRQDIILQPLSEPVLFAIHPVYAGPQTPEDIRVNRRTEQLFSQWTQEDRPRVEYRYAVVTTGLVGGIQLDVTRLAGRVTNLTDLTRLAFDPALVAFDASQFPTLKKTADEVVSRRGVTGGKRADVARALRDHFLQPGAYQYTLDFSQVRRRRELDPIEDFVANHHSGHCEYFASALVMMLRSQGIPARMVVGFRGGEYNALGDYYQVLQRHAHAWVEAYLPPDEARSESPPEAELSPLGGWLRLDPTPGSDIDRARQLEQGWMDTVDDVLDYASTVWTDYILGLTAKRQRESIYEPVANRTDPETWASVLEQLRGVREQLRGWVQTASLILLPLLALGLAAALVLSWRRWRQGRQPGLLPALWQWRRNGGPPANQRPAASTTVQFYRRLEVALGQLGLNRCRGQTPRELAAQASQRLAALLPQAAVAELPSQIVATFYRVRFGQADLPDEASREVESQLVRLEEAVQRTREHGSPLHSETRAISS
jgi:protein-glutamine gamma-glutamyltransferase